MASKEAHGSGAPIQPTSKGSKVEPQVNSDMELGSLGKTSAEEATTEADIMQAARTGDIPAMEKLFESQEYDATYADDEGITALHVRPHGSHSSHGLVKHGTGSLHSS